jgi:hypothetical protein
MDKGRYSGYRDLKVYSMSYDLALEIQQVAKTFPRPSIPQGERIG